MALVPSAATHAVLPLVATRPGRRLQIDAGLRSHRRRFGAPTGSGFPSAPTARARAAPGRARPAALLHRPERPRGPARRAGARSRRRPARSPSRSTGRPSQLVWSRRRLSLRSGLRGLHRPRSGAAGCGRSGAAPTTRTAASVAPTQHARRVRRAVAQRLAAFGAQRGKPGLVTFAVDTELLGHWWAEGPAWLEAVVGHVPERGVRLVTLPQALERHQPEERTLHDSTWGEGKDLRTWDSPEVADLAWAPAAPRAAAAQRARPGRARAWGRAACARASSSPCRRAIGRSSTVAARPASIRTSARPTTRERSWTPYTPPSRRDPRLRSLAPDLSLAPLLEP